MAESTDDDSIMVSKSQEYNIKHYSDSMINTSNQVCPKTRSNRAARTVIQKYMSKHNFKEFRLTFVQNSKRFSLDFGELLLWSEFQTKPLAPKVTCY